MWGGGGGGGGGGWTSGQGFSTDYISMRLAGKGPGCGATLFSLIDVTRISKVQLHRRTARISSTS